jgi:hypothetical protein
MIDPMKMENNFAYLLAAMVFLIVVSPLIDAFWQWPELRPQGLIFDITLLLAVFGIHDNRKVLIVGIVLVLVSFISSAISMGRPVGLWDYIGAFSFTLFLLMALWICILQTYQQYKISANTLMGAICIYLLLGMIWTSLYAALYALDASSFRGLSASANFHSTHEWAYFSFVTMTTLGYGDIVPVSQAARTLAIVQAIAGQFYIAMLVAGLVGAYLVERRSEDRH